MGNIAEAPVCALGALQSGSCCGWEAPVWRLDCGTRGLGGRAGETGAGGPEEQTVMGACAPAPQLEATGSSNLE